MRITMKLLIFIALLVSVTLVRAQNPEDDLEISEYDGLNGDFDAEPEISAEPLEVPDGDDEDDDENEEDEDEILPTTSYPTRRRWPGYKCMLDAKRCFMNATDCEEYLACYEQKSTCMQAAKKDQKPFMKRPSKMICKTVFNKCLERAGSDCFKKYMCYRKKGFCYRSRGRGYRKPCGHHFGPHHRGRRPTMNPEMLKCKMQWRQCFMRANSCSERLQCMFAFHDCMNRSHPTGPPPTMGPDEDEENMNVYRRRWNPKLMAKCKKEFKECIENSSSSCPLKMRCFWRMKMCFNPHHRPHYGYKNKMIMMKITRTRNQFGGQWGNRGMGRGYGQTGRQWGNRGMGTRFGETGRQWGNRGMGHGHGQTGRHWGNRGMGRGHGQTGRQWGNMGIGRGRGQTGRQWGNRGIGRGRGQTGRQWANRGYKQVKKVLKPMQKKFKNMWQRHLG